MTSYIHHIPFFDKLELELVPDFIFARQEKLVPLQAGASVAGLFAEHNTGNWHPYFNEITLDTSANFLRYTHKPLLLYFYNHAWGQVSLEHLGQLNALAGELQPHNVNVLVVTAGTLEEFDALTVKANWLLEGYEDRNNELAGLLNIYSERNPSWSRYAGIEGNLPLPALYLLDHSRQIAFGFANEALLSKLPVEAVKQILLYKEKYWVDLKSA